MGDGIIMVPSPSNQEYIRDVAEIDLQEFKDIENIAFYQVAANSGSGLSMESERSLRIHICADRNGVNFLLEFLHHLVDSKESYRGVTNLLFHGIEWQPEAIQLLCSYLGPVSNVKQVEFQKNVFSTKSAVALVPLSEMLQRNNTLKAVVFNDCRIGATGATLLASALGNNRSVEEFQVWEDSMGSKGAEELSKMIEVNYMLKLLIILDNSSIPAAPLISAVLARNRRVEVHIWGRSRDTRGGMDNCKIVEFLPETGNMRIYNNINSTGLQRVACALAWNTTVTTLDMTGVPLKSRWTKELREVLDRNRSLKVVKLTKCCLRDKAVVYIAAGLFKNKYLESLTLDGNRFGGVGLEHLLCPLSTFSPLQTQANSTLKVLSFGGKRTNIGRYGVAAILQMLETNQSLIQLAICDDASLTSSDVVNIFTTLQRNATLRILSFRGCKGVEGEAVLQTIMNTLQVNPWIEEIDLHETPLHVAGKTGQIYEKLGQNGSLVLPNDLLDLPLSAPTCCRVVLCGQELAGKSTLCSSMNRCMNAMNFPRMDVRKTLKTPVEQMPFSDENKMNSIFDGNTKLTMCNLGGNEGNFALHDFMFVVLGGPSFFMIVSSLVGKPATKYPKSIDEIEWELIYWLRFLISNYRRRVSQLHSFRPCVTIVLTHYDKVSHLPEGLQPIATVVQRLREDFHSDAEIYPTVFAVDSRSLVSVSKLTHHLRKTTKTIIQQVPQVYEVCNDLIKILHDWRLKNSRAVIRWAEFCEICQLNIPSLRLRSRRDNVEKVDTRRRAVAKSLHTLGEIVFFEELGLLVMNCEWFCRDVLSQLATLKSIKIESSGGFVHKEELEKVLQEKLQNQIPRTNWRTGASLQASDIINILLELELCYEQDPGNPHTLLLLPAILEENKVGTEKWQLTMPECRFVGRRLECEDIHMLLTSDFFPRLQVRLHNKIMCLGQQEAVYNLEKNLIYTVINGVHVKVELGMRFGSSIDVLACSGRNITDMVRLLHKFVIPTILNLSPNMTFKENILRPDCVKYLIPRRFRATQQLPLKKIKQILLSLPAESIYDYQHTWNAVESNRRLILRSGSDHARDLLSDDDFHEVLHRRYYDLQFLATELAVTPDNLQQPETIPEAGVVDPSILGIARGVEMVLQRLKIIEQGIRDLKEEIASLRYYEYHLVTELHRKMDYVMNYSIQLEDRKVPQMFYLVSLDNRSRKLVTRILPGMRSLRVHMLCEFRREMHVVEDQIGCDLIQVDNQAVQSLLPYMSKFMKLLTFALKIGAHFIVGMGEMIPDLSREVVHLLDSSAMYGAASVGALGAAAMYGRARNSGTNDMGEDMKAARQWLVDFLRGQGVLTGMDIAQRFGLWRVRYRDDGHIGWVCRKHIAARGDEVFELPL
ncbi:protein TORNADO 1 [Hordeum vulgare subsp. vulgare]|uniref:C-terminal of Roc (COR) domain-containing protein n=1 Tax=Hordeum vulgare subsp. vulgare TaxID=112509 RepID=A0A8I6YK13_HORVV|nr:protein TORNADO 1 [Hordeum vulgare subsp. vulgare]